MTIGDVIAVIVALAVVLVSLNAISVLIISTAPDRVRIGISGMTKTPWRTLLQGFAAALIALIGVVQFHSAESIPQKFLFGIILAVLASCAAFGSAVLVAFVADRLATKDNSLTPSRAIYQSGFLCLGASIAPILGWFVIAPTMLILALGSGMGVFFQFKPAQEQRLPISTTQESTV
jgi:hypothetical protein